MSEAATPTDVTTVAPVATPDNSQPETVTLTKEQHEQLSRDAARASSNQRKADLYDNASRPPKTGTFKPAPTVTPPSEQEEMDSAAFEDRKAEKGLTRIAADPAYREILDADPTLRDLLINNPLAVLPLLADDAINAEDAITLVKASLDKRKKPVEAKPADTQTPPVGKLNQVPPIANPAPETTDADYESARKQPNLESAIASMVSIGRRRMGN